MKTETVVKADSQNVNLGYHHQNESCDTSANIDLSISRASYMCRKCKVHGKLIPVKRHKRSCVYLHCKCIKCLLVDQGRKVVAKQIALYRDQRHVNPDERHEEESLSRSHKISIPFKETITANGLGPHCRRCRNHNVTVIWKNHKKTCPYRHCPCDPCRLINVRKDTEKTLRDMVRGSPNCNLESISLQQIVTDESTICGRNKNAYSLYGSYPCSTMPSKSPNTSYQSTMDKSNFELYPRSLERSLTPNLSSYYNTSPGFLGHGMNSSFQRLATTCSATGDLPHLAHISSPFSNSDRFCSNSDLSSSTAFKSLGGGFMMNGRSQPGYQSLECHPDMWGCLNPARSMIFPSYNMGSDYCGSTYSYLNSLGMSSQDAGQTNLAHLTPMLDLPEPDNSSALSVYRNFTDYCY